MTILYTLGLITYLFFFIENDQPWKKSLDKNDIVIYTRKVAGSPFHEFLAETEMTGSKEKFRQIITDFDNYTEWSPDCKSVEVIKEDVPLSYTYHMKLKVPFPFSNRDIIQELIFKETDSELHVLIKNHPNKVESLGGYVRMKKGDGEWLIKQKSPDKIYIRFQYLADPGGEIPAWLVNSFIVKNPYKSLQNIRKIMME